MKKILLVALIVMSASNVCAEQSDAASAAQSWKAYANGGQIEAVYHTEAAGQESKYATETRRLVNELKSIPVSEYEENYIRYSKLVEYNPNVQKYADKTAFYKSKMDEKKEKEKSDAQKRKNSEWSYSTSTDDMTSKKVKTAKVISGNEHYFSFPYTGAQSAVLILRKHPRYGNDVMLTIQRGQFLCGPYRNNKILVRFDDDKPKRFTCSDPADNDSSIIFINGYNKFVSYAKKAERIRIEATIYQEGAPVWEFKTKDLIF